MGALPEALALRHPLLFPQSEEVAMPRARMRLAGTSAAAPAAFLTLLTLLIPPGPCPRGYGALPPRPVPGWWCSGRRGLEEGSSVVVAEARLLCCSPGRLHWCQMISHRKRIGPELLARCLLKPEPLLMGTSPHRPKKGQGEKKGERVGLNGCGFLAEGNAFPPERGA